MKIKALEKNSFVDYPGHLSCVVFTQGCNMNCFYCHNKPLISNEEVKDGIGCEEVLDFLSKRQKFIDAVVISGGEPTLQNGLEDFTRDVRKMGFKVKLDTNGTNPEVVENLISKKLVDYVAMDIKAPLKRYEEFCKVKTDINCIKKSIAILMEGAVDYEFRTTLAPGLGVADILDISEEIKGAKSYIIQRCRMPDGAWFNPAPFADAIKSISKTVKNIGMRGIEISA